MKADLKSILAETDGRSRNSAFERGPPPLALRQGTTAAALMAKSFDPVRYIVPGYLAEGCTLLAGAPKIGKSWLALNLAVAISGGRPAFGSITSEIGDVLYLALEDNERRLKKRLIQMGLREAPDRLNLQTQWPTIGQGCLKEIDSWARAVPCPLLVIVDVLQRVKPEATNNQQQYEADYKAVTGLQNLASKFGMAVLVLTHTRKMDAEDPFDSVSGTRGLTGAADTVLVLKRDNGTGVAGRATIYGRGRDIEEIETVVEFNRDNGTWRIVGMAHEIAKTNERQAILDVLKSSSGPLNAREISDRSGKKYEAVRKTLTRMAANGEASKEGRGLFRCPIGPIEPSLSILTV
ncbi:MAG: AAA family ATPase [Sphingomicrobium sp.]